jgi:cathepsin D
MYGPPDEVKKVYAQVEGSKQLTGDLTGFYSFPCDKVPKISFKWGNGKAWTISDAK